MTIAPDLQCSVENGIDSVMGPWRGIFAKKGTPQEAIDALVAAIEEAKQSDTWKEFTHNAAYDERPIPAPGEETVEFCHNIGLTYVSCSPFRVPIARLAAAPAASREQRQ